MIRIAVFNKICAKIITLFFICLSFSSLSEQILYLSNADGDLELYVSDLTSGKTIKLTDNELDDSQASWSPDGKWIVYTGRVGAGLEVFIIASDGKHMRQLTNNKYGADYFPEWSADSENIVYVSQDENTYSLNTININTNKKQVLIKSETELKSPKWSPNSKYISYISAKEKISHLHLYDFKSQLPSKLTNSEKEQQLSFNWSPNSMDIVFAAKRKKMIDLFSINVKTKQEKQLTQLWTLDTEPAYSPDGNQLLFLSSRDDKVRRQLFLADATLNKVKAITPISTEVLDPSWSLTGDQVAYSLYQKRRFVIVIKDLVTGKARPLNPLDKGYQYQPKFRPTS